MGNDGRDWMYYHRRLPEFETGVNEFLDASFATSAIGDLNERDREEVGYEDDENEDIEDDLRLQDVNEADGESVDDDENESIEEFENNNNGSEDEFENEDVELEIFQVPESQKGTCLT
ncbi:hypothetical protein Tco_1569963 [Tanacetum coccineum]